MVGNREAEVIDGLSEGEQVVVRGGLALKARAAQPHFELAAMARQLFKTALGNRLMTIILVVTFVAIGVRAMLALPIDASPDVTPNVVTIVTEAPGLGPAEVEKLITFPVEVTMRGLPGIRRSVRSRGSASPRSRSISRSSSTSTSLAALLTERLPSVAAMIPKGYGPPEMTPVSTTLGEIFQFEVVDPKRSLMELRSIPRLADSAAP